jgi:hypothetical protein
MARCPDGSDASLMIFDAPLEMIFCDLLLGTNKGDLLFVEFIPRYGRIGTRLAPECTLHHWRE